MSENKNTVFEAEALPYFDAVYSFAYSLARETSFAEDLTQDTFFQAYRKFHSFELGTNCKAWLFRICKNLFIDKFRQTKRRPVHQTVESCDPAVTDKSYAQRMFEAGTFEARSIENDDVFLDLFGDEVNGFLQELPSEFRRSLMMCDLEGLTYQEIAEVEEIPIGTVRSRISRARSFLRERLEEYATELGFMSGAVSGKTMGNDSDANGQVDTK